MKKILLETSFSKIYMIVMVIITLLILGGYFSYAMFTVSKEKSNAISIVTGNLTYKLEVDGEEENILTVESNSVKDFTITLSNPNNRVARFNFYYLGDLPSHIKVGYIMTDGVNAVPIETGVNLEKEGTAGSSNTYTIRVINNSESSVTINLGVSVGLDYNDLSLPENGHLFEEITYEGEVGTVVLSNISKDNICDDGVDTFTTGQYPNNYVWYSGKLWRAVSVNNEEKTVKLVTQWNMSAIPYSSGSTAFEGSYMEEWLNDTTVDGFLGNLRDYENFIVTDAAWDATMDDRDLGEITRPDGTTIVEDAVGLLNIYEYKMSYTGTSSNKGYLNTNLYWWTLTPYSTSFMQNVHYMNGVVDNFFSPINGFGVRPSIILKSNIQILDGNGTEDEPYRIEGDNDANLEGMLLNTRYSGEYISFGTGENNLYRIVSHETEGLTKITSAEPLKENRIFKTISFGDTVYYSSTNTIGSFLNGEYLTSGEYLTDEQVNMIENSTAWYLGMVSNGTSYKLAKYEDTNISKYTTSTNTKVGLLRIGEMMSGQFDKINNTHSYWLLTPYTTNEVRVLGGDSNAVRDITSGAKGVQPSLNLKSNVIITGGDGTKNNPFTLALAP